MPVIAFVMQRFYGDQIGGAERQVQMLGAALRERGWQTDYISERPVGKPQRENIAGMEVFALPLRKKRSSLLNYLALKQAMKDSRADLYYQRVRQPYTGMAAHIAKSLKKPFVWAAASMADTVREKDLRAASGRVARLDRLLQPANRFLEDGGMRHADAIILQTVDQRQSLEENYHLSGTVIPNHLQAAVANQVQKRQPPEVVWISNIKPFKQPELFLELARRCRDLSAKFVMIGLCGDQSVKCTLEEENSRSSNFAYLGPLEPELAEMRIAEATLLVNTSLFEGFPNAFQQAWYHGVPTLSLGVDPDAVIRNEGLGCVAGNIEELTQIVRRLLADAEAMARIGAKARQFARSRYDLQTLLPRYLEIFERLIHP